MPTNDPVPPSGEASSSVSRKGGKPAKAVPRAARAAARPDLDARDQRITLPRRAMGPPLGSTVGARAASAARRPKTVEVKATDPAKAVKRAARKRG